MKKGNNHQGQTKQQEEGEEDNEFQDVEERFRSESQTQKLINRQTKRQQSLQNSIEIDAEDDQGSKKRKKSFTLKIGKIKVPELPQANEILPKSAQKKEEPNYVIGNEYINIINLDGNHPEEERLWTKQSKSNLKLDTKQQGSNKDNCDEYLKIQMNKSPNVSPQPNQLPSYLQSQYKELSSLLKDYEIIYQKYPQHMYSSFNIVQCDLKKIQEILALKKNNIDPDLLVKQENKKDEHYFSSDNKTVSYFQSNGSALDCLQQNLQEKQQQDLSIQFTKSCQYEGIKTRKHADSLQLDIIDKKHSIDDSASVLLDKKSTKSKEYSSVSAASKAVLASVSQQTNEIESINKNFNISLDLTKSKVQQNNSGIIKKQNKSSLVFESKFECGNLSYAFQKTERQYLLILQNDINTKGFTQWFYFRVSNQKLKGQVTFSILNYHKSYSLFNQGMKVLVYSKKKREKQDLGWHRSCTNITYQRNEYKRQSNKSTLSTYYTLEFTYDFSEQNDEVFFAYNYPYTYSDLQNYLESIERDSYKRQFVNRKVMCRTLAENRVDLLTITDGSSNYHINKQTIVVSARVHPGETVSSFMIKGLIDFLLEDTPDSSYLRNNFIFKIIPMLNPDGVIHGNYRCSLAGRDLNRQWKKPSKGIFAEIHFLKKLILNTKRLVLFCDLHGHSIKKNIFVYGCHDYSQPSACRELPYIISKIYQPFSFKDCNFKIQMEKQGTARVALWKTLRIPNIFTLESSFCGPSYDDIHFRLQDLQTVGKVLCQAFMIYFEPSQVKQGNHSSRRNSNSQKTGEINEQSSRQNSEFKEDFILKQKNQLNSINNLMNLLNINKQDIQDELQQNQDLIQMGMKDSDGSDSCPSEDEIENVLKQPIPTEDPKLEASKSPSPKKSLKKFIKKGNDITKTNLINCQPFQRPVAFNSSTSNATEREPIKPLNNLKRLEVACKSRLVLNDDLPQQPLNLNSISPRNNIPQKLKQKSSLNHKSLQNKRDISIPNSVLTHNNSNNSNLLVNPFQEKSPLRKNLEPIEMQQDETVNLKSTLIFKRNPLYDYYESVQPKMKVKASDLGNLKRNLENEINNIVNNKRSLTPTKMIPNRLDQILNYNLNSYNVSSVNSNNINNFRNLSSNQSQNHNNRHFANEQKLNYFPSIKRNQISKDATPSIPQKLKNSNDISIVQNFQSYLNSNNNHVGYHNQRNYSQQLKLEDESIFIPQNITNLTPINPNNKSLENSTIIQGQQQNSKSPYRLRKKYSFYQNQQLQSQNNNNSYLNTEPSEVITINTFNQRVETEAYIIEELNNKHRRFMAKNNPTRSSSTKKKISLVGDSSINNTETLSYQPTSIKSKKPFNRISVISAVNQQNLSNQNKIRLNEDFNDYIKFGNQNPFR